MAKDTYYFSHDANARNDEKILMLRAEHGMAGYGIYWALVESMFENEDTMLRHDKIKGLALVLNIDITLLHSVINTCITENLFKSDDENFWSDSLMRRKNKYQEIKKSKSEAGKKGMQKRWGNVDNSDVDNTVITEKESVITKDNKLNQIKENKIKEKKNKSNTIADVSTSETLWNLYPNKKGKAQAITKIPKLITKYGYEQMERTITRYCKEIRIKQTASEYIKHGSTFFNSGYVDYLDENYKEENISEYGRHDQPIKGSGKTETRGELPSDYYDFSSIEM